MIYLSKSKYCGLWQCPKIAWMRKYNYDLLTAASILCTTPELLRIKVADELRLTDPYIFDVSHAVPNE